MEQQRESLLARSAKGASVLIGLQVGSRALTFAVNQILLRLMSRELLGISTQLELLVITILTFSRESLRISLTRLTGVAASSSSSKDKENTKSSKKQNVASDQSSAVALSPQEAINLAYIAPVLGLILSASFGYLYLHRASKEVYNIPYLEVAVYICGASAFLELVAEPCFAIVSQRGLLGIRARAETSATICRCLVSLALASWGNSTGRQLGALPFAAGQLTFGLVLNMVYWYTVGKIVWGSGIKLWPKFIQDIGKTGGKNSQVSRRFMSLFAKPALFLAITLYAQSVLKHFLTQGDSFLVSLFGDLSSQGTYALVSNYGSLMARLLFQPIEESSRGVLGSLLGSTTNKKSSNALPKDNISAAQRYLETILKFYALISLGIVSIGPHLSPILLRVVAGTKWGDSSAGSVLGLYCYYIPLLAFNGILEAFVAATASPSQLRLQSLWMGFFSTIYALTGYICLEYYHLGAVGLMVANAVNMAIRVLWSLSYVVAFFKGQQADFHVSKVLPRFELISSAVVTALIVRSLSAGIVTQELDLYQLAQCFLVAGVFGASLLFLERDFLIGVFRLVSSRK